MEQPRFGDRPPAALPLAFFATGLVGFVALALAVALDPRAVRWPPGPHGILLLHLTVLGWLTPVMMGADYQLIPVVLHRPIARPGLGAAVWVLYALGAAAFLAGWAAARPSWIAGGGALAGAGLLLFCGHVGPALLGAGRRSPVALGLGGGVAFLALAAVAGPWMALGIGGALPPPPLHLRAAHAAAGLAGWLLLTIMGATYQLVPFFAGTPAAVAPRFGRAAVLCAGAGAALLLLAGLAPRLPAAPGLLGVAAGVALWAWDQLRLALHGRQARREPVVAYSLAAIAAMGGGGAVAVLAWSPAPRLALAGALAGVVAGPTLLVVGQMQKILPFTVAVDAALAAGRRGHPPKTEALFPRARARALLLPFLCGLAAEVAGTAADATGVLRAGAIVVAAAAVLYAAQQSRALLAWAGPGRAGR